MKIYFYFKVESFIVLCERGCINLLKYNVINNEENIYVLVWELKLIVRIVKLIIIFDCLWFDGICIKFIFIYFLLYSIDYLKLILWLFG